MLLQSCTQSLELSASHVSQLSNSVSLKQTPSQPASGPSTKQSSLPSKFLYLSHAFSNLSSNNTISSSERFSILGSNSSILKSSGILYVPVHHMGNEQSSEEEIVVIKQLIKDLMEQKDLQAKYFTQITDQVNQPLMKEYVLMVTQIMMVFVFRFVWDVNTEII